MKPVWGRLSYFAEVGFIGGGKIYTGALLTLEAQNTERRIRWSKSLDPDDQKELDRLRADGHQVTEKAKYYEIVSSAEAMRTTQLRRTVLHEIGHWVDYLQKVERCVDAAEGSWDELFDRYLQRPAAEREMFAHRYAKQLANAF